MHDRALLLSERKRNDVLALREVQQYGRDSFGDPDYVSLYGLTPAEWYERGIRILARTAVECTRDRLADLMGREIAAVARTAPGASGSVVVDPFAGSCNTLLWIARHMAPRLAIGFETDAAVFTATRKNLSLLGVDIALVHDHYEAGLQTLHVSNDQLLTVFVAPPWGDALSETSGLDLRRTTPPVSEVVDRIQAGFGGHKLLVATQVYERVDPGSVAELTARFAWSALRIYDIDAPGRNHGLLLGARGWTP